MTNEQVAEIMETYPDRVADALLVFRKATAERERVEGRRHLELKADLKVRGEYATAEDVKAMLKSDDVRFQAVMCEIAAEAMHQRLYEILMVAKKTASLRAAF